LLWKRALQIQHQSHNLRQIAFLAPKSLQTLAPLLSIKGPHGVVPMLRWTRSDAFTSQPEPAPIKERWRNMKKLLFALAALSVLGTVIPAKAACPPGTIYNCTSTFNGKQSCGCR
jgi:hypothetical protein